MILVVTGHAYNQNSLITSIYWFHMPAFFLFSGYVSKPINQYSQIRTYLKKRANSLLLPYVKYLGLFTAIRYLGKLIQGNMNWNWYVKDIGNLLFGGRFITSYYGVFWFVTCLFFTQVLFFIIFLVFKKNKTRLLFIFILYTISHIESSYVGALSGSEPSLHVLIPWNIDVSMLALFYYSIGYYAKKYLKQISFLLTGCCLILTVGFITLQEINLLDYHLSMKYIAYDHYFLDAVIPLLMTTAYCGIFQLIETKRVLSFFTFINKKSIAIMYMHIGINKILLHFMNYGNVMYVIVGVTVPIFIMILAQEGERRAKSFFLDFLPRHSELRDSKEVRVR